MFGAYMQEVNLKVL